MSSAASNETPALVFEYVALHDLTHDGETFHKGDVFRTSDRALGEQLRADKAIALAHELQAADDVAARIAELEAQLKAAQDALEARSADALATGDTATGEDTSGKPAAAAKGKNS